MSVVVAKKNYHGQNQHPTRNMRISKSYPWRVEDSDLKVFPCYCTLERTHVIIYDSTAPVISGRISEFSRINSLFLARWSNREPHSCHCSTDDFLSLEINLWKVKNAWDNAHKKNGILVEVRRRSGDSLDAHKLKNRLIRAIRGPKMTKQRQLFREAKAVNAGRMNDCSPAPISTIQFTSPLPNDFLKKTVLSVSSASDLIKLKMAPEIKNGMELVDYLTGTKHINAVNRGQVNTMILTGVDPFGRENDVMNVIYEHAVDNSNKAAHRWAIKIVGNALLDVRNGGVILKPRNFDFWRAIIPVMLQDMKHVDEDPHLACFAVRCLRAWVVAKKICKISGRTLDSYTADSMDPSELKNIIIRMATYGKEKYANLEIESLELLAWARMAELWFPGSRN